MTAERDPIEQYLDRLLLELRGRATDAYRILYEVDAHLRESIDDGATPQEAIANFGSPRAVARRFEPADGPILPDLFSMAWKLGALGLIAVGLSGVLTMGLRAMFGSSFVAGDPIGVTYTAARCADYREYHPEATSCGAAASAHHADEVEEYRVAAGLLGLGAFGLWWKLRRGVNPLPIELDATVAAVAFGVATLACLSQALPMLAEGVHHGAGQWLSAAVVSFAAAAFASSRVLRTLRLHAA